jgi:protein required for attachment to host cells
MHRTCIAVVDAARARILTFDRIVDATGIRDELIEHEELVNSTRRAAAAAASADHAHHHAPFASLDAAFARAIVRRLAAHTADRRVTAVVLCASPHMLGELRRDAVALQRPHLRIHELARNLIELAPHALEAQLAAHGMR